MIKKDGERNIFQKKNFDGETREILEYVKAKRLKKNKCIM